MNRKQSVLFLIRLITLITITVVLAIMISPDTYWNSFTVLVFITIEVVLLIKRNEGNT